MSAQGIMEVRNHFFKTSSRAHGKHTTANFPATKIISEHKGVNKQ